MNFWQRTAAYIQSRRIDLGIVVGIFILAALPRMLTLGTFLTADEKNWIGRSYEFVRAFKDFRFNDMLQTTHPGVTTLWLSGLSVTAKMYLSHTPFNGGTLANFIHAGQWPIALVNALAVPLMYVFLRKLLRQRTIPLIAAVCIALDPLLIGYSRVAHVDALLASFLFLAALATLICIERGYDKRWLVASAVLSSLAILTKIPGVFIIPFFFLALLAQGKNVWAEKSYLVDRARDVTIWILVLLMLGIILWPAIMWVPNPAGNALAIKRDLVVAVGTPHDMTEDYTLNAWHYPAALLDRTTPVTFVLTLVAVGALLTALLRKSVVLDQRIWWLIISYIFFFIVMMTLGAKKGDRYILPVWPAIDTLAAFGLYSLLQWRRRVGYVLGAGAALYLLFTVASYHPYAIAYSNPLFPDNWSQELGWGEGLDQVAAWLNTNHPDAVVASWYPEELGALTSARVAHINAHEQLNVRYVVLYRNMFGRDKANPANDFIDEYYKKKTPVFVARVQGKEFAWVYEKHVYERVIGEMVPGMEVSQAVTISHPHLAGLELGLATYSGKAAAGVVNVALTQADKTVAVWELPVKDIEDAKPTAVTLPDSAVVATGPAVIHISATGTSAGNAPTVRYTKDFTWRPESIAVNGKATAGNLSVRLRYMLPNNQIATEDDTRLF
jgi:hypothetical protein